MTPDEVAQRAGHFAHLMDVREDANPYDKRTEGELWQWWQMGWGQAYTRSTGEEFVPSYTELVWHKLSDEVPYKCKTPILIRQNDGTYKVVEIDEHGHWVDGKEYIGYCQHSVVFDRWAYID
jgi:hypothetical protein